VKPAAHRTAHRLELDQQFPAFPVARVRSEMAIERSSGPLAFAAPQQEGGGRFAIEYARNSVRVETAPHQSLPGPFEELRPARPPAANELLLVRTPCSLRPGFRHLAKYIAPFLRTISKGRTQVESLHGVPKTDVRNVGTVEQREVFRVFSHVGLPDVHTTQNAYDQTGLEEAMRPRFPGD
jgi:hypothetical protein